MREIDPGAGEDAAHLGAEDGGVGIDQPVDAILLHELVPIVLRTGLERHRQGFRVVA